MTSRRKLAAVATLILVIGVLAVISLHPHWVVDWLAHRSPEVVYFADTGHPAVALTIDDSPDSTVPSLILDVLKQHNAHATFFIITDRIAGNESLITRMIDEDHELGNHLTRDEPSVRLQLSEFERRLLAAHEVLSAYSEVRWFRPGGGWFNDAMLAMLRKHGYSCALGSVYPYDAAIPSSWFATRYILGNVRPGSVIVLHDIGRRGLRTVATLRAILPKLKAKGFEVVSLSTLVPTGYRCGSTESLAKQETL